MNAPNHCRDVHRTNDRRWKEMKSHVHQLITHVHRASCHTICFKCSQWRQWNESSVLRRYTTKVDICIAVVLPAVTVQQVNTKWSLVWAAVCRTSDLFLLQQVIELLVYTVLCLVTPNIYTHTNCSSALTLTKTMALIDSLTVRVHLHLQNLQNEFIAQKNNLQTEKVKQKEQAVTSSSPG